MAQRELAHLYGFHVTAIPNGSFEDGEFISERADRLVGARIMGRRATIGLLVAAALGYALGVKNTFTVNVELCTGIDELRSRQYGLPATSQALRKQIVVRMTARTKMPP